MTRLRGIALALGVIAFTALGAGRCRPLVRPHSSLKGWLKAGHAHPHVHPHPHGPHHHHPHPHPHEAGQHHHHPPAPK